MTIAGAILNNGRRWRPFFFILLAIIFLAACGGDDTPSAAPAAETTIAATTTVPATATAVPANAPTEEPAIEPAAEVSELAAEAGMLDLGALTEHPWQWVSFTNPVELFDVDMPEHYLLTFKNDGTVAIVADCNNAAGSYTADGGRLTLAIDPTTMAACAPASRSDQFVKLLGGAAIFFFEEGRLFIDLMADGGTMVFAPAGERASSATEGSDETTALAAILGNLSYAGLFPDGPISLADGYATYDEGSSAEPYVRLLDQLIVTGDLDGDGAEDAVTLLDNNPSGSGRFVYLVVVLDALANPAPTDGLMIGDRIQVKSLAIDGSRIVADLVAHGPDDVLCCPSWNVRKVFALEDDRLVERSSEEVSRISLDDLSDTEWRLLGLNGQEEPVLPETEITLHMEDGLLSGSAGCNEYSSTVSSGPDGLNSLDVGPATATRRACPDPIMNQETAYLAHLGDAVAWWFDTGRLALTYPVGERDFGYLLFESQAGK